MVLDQHDIMQAKRQSRQIAKFGDIPRERGDFPFGSPIDFAEQSVGRDRHLGGIWRDLLSRLGDLKYAGEHPNKKTNKPCNVPLSPGDLKSQSPAGKPQDIFETTSSTKIDK
jgi:hypothetical protein